MPRNVPKGFAKIAKRWRKMYRGERYEVYCSQLHLPEEQWTEGGSYQARNDWWAAKKMEIDAKPPARRPDVEEVVRSLQAKRRVLAAAGEDTAEYDDAIRDARRASRPLLDPKLTFASLDDEIEAVRRVSQPEGDGVNVLDPRTSARAEFLAALGVDLSGLDAASIKVGLGFAAYWAEKFAKVEQVPVDRRVGTLLDGWFLLKRRKLAATTLVRLQGHKKAFECLKHREKVLLSVEMPADVLTELKVEAVFHAIDGEVGGEATKKKKWLAFKSFVGHVEELGLIPMPRNLDSRDLSFTVPLKQKARPVIADVRGFVDSLPPRLMLYALLAANAGMNNIDIGKLEPRQIDLNNQTLTRKRVKTKDWDNVPTVTYWLWDETAQLLRREMALSGEYAPLNSKGQPLYVDTKDGPKGASLYDKIKSSWRDHIAHQGPKNTHLKIFGIYPRT